MNDVFTKFYSNKIKEIHDFFDSDSDILYVSGFSGSGKSSVLKTAIKTYNKDILKFHHLCFKKTVIDDFLLSFYDSFREHSLKQKITLKKNPEEGFMQRVSFYFNTLESPCLVIVDNFEKISDDSEITDFLLHISSFENVKLVVISKNPTCRLIENPTVGVSFLNFEKITLEEFSTVFKSKFKDANDEILAELYEATGGYELYLRMILTYLESITITLADFVEDYKLKNLSFEDYIIEKQVSLIPSTYYPILENLSCIYHNIPQAFIESYQIGDMKQIQYLLSKFMVSEFFGTYYIKSYLRKYFVENTALQNKVAIFNKLISIYENELKMSPKDRLLRLSRESIRNQIALLEEKMPKVQQISSAPAFNYVAHAISANPQWFVTGVNPKDMKGMSSKKRSPLVKPQLKRETKPVHTGPSLFDKTFEQGVILENEYRYKEAIAVFEEAKSLAKNISDKKDSYSKVAQNALKLNDNNLALSNLREICEICLEENDTNSYSNFRIEIGKIYKKLYAFSRAKACFEEVIKKEDTLSKKTVYNARISLAEIYELENDIEKAISEYKIAIDLILNTEGETSLILPEISYKLALIYDENGYYEEAVSEYKNSIQYAEISSVNTYLIKSYSACGVILSDLNETDEALQYLEYAYNLSMEEDSFIDTYYITRNIAEIYKNIDTDKAYEYLMIALEYARLSENAFEMALSLIELGDYYYNLKQNEQALICYFQAKNSLGAQATKENLERVMTRINDMKIKLGDYVFRGMEQLYDSN